MLKTMFGVVLSRHCFKTSNKIDDIKKRSMKFCFHTIRLFHVSRSSWLTALNKIIVLVYITKKDV